MAATFDGNMQLFSISRFGGERQRSTAELAARSGDVIVGDGWNILPGMQKTLRIGALVALLGLAACAGSHIDTVWDTQFAFIGLNTFDWAPREPEAGAGAQYGSLDTVIRGVVDRHMAAAGFTRSSNNPSFLVTYYIGIEEVARLQESYYGRGWGGYWGWGWYGPVGLNVSQYDTGTITIDVLSPDPALGLIWRGIARAELRPSSPGSGKLEGAIRKVLEDFPPAEGSS